VGYAEARKTFIETIKIFQAKDQTLTQAYRMAWKMPMRFYSLLTAEQAYEMLNERYPTQRKIELGRG
jgi:hypothetical protein